MGKRKVFPGQVYGQWTVVDGEKRRGYDNTLLHKCLCSCGSESFHPASRLIGKLTTMCKSCSMKLPMHKGMKQFKDLSGLVFSKWTVLERLSGKVRSGEKVLYACRCDCGSVHRVQAGNLRGGISRQCSECSGKGSFGAGNNQWKGFMEIPSRYLTNIKNGARVRNLEYGVSNEYIWDLFLSQERRCALSGVPIKFGSPRLQGDNTASLDRIVSSVGYIEGNVQWLHTRVNVLKMAFDESEFVGWAEKIADHQREKYACIKSVS